MKFIVNIYRLMGKSKNILNLKKGSAKRKEHRKLQIVLKNIELKTKKVQNPVEHFNNQERNTNDYEFVNINNENIYDSSDDENENDEASYLNEEKRNDGEKENIYDLSLENFLKVWAVKYFVNRNTLNVLLKFLNNKIDKKIPHDYRKLLQTPRQIPLNYVDPGNYVHIGLKKHVDKFLKKCDIIPSELKIRINVDGLPIYKDSSCVPAFWLIQGDFYGFIDNPFIIGCYGGITKPKEFNNLLKKTVDEFDSLEDYNYNENNVKVVLHKFLADAPAKSSILNTISHNGYFACPKCETEGKFLENKMCYADIDAKLRSDITFRNKENEEYHFGSCILEELHYFNMVDDVMVDYMHTVLLGVTKKLMRTWFIDSNSRKLSNYDKNEISKKIEKINETMPIEFQRKIRNLNYVNHFKATEFRSFLLFYGPVVLKHALEPSMYNHFMKLHTAIKILCDKKFHVKFNNIADILLRDFINDMAEIYGEKEVVYNVHLLCHLANEALKNGTLDEFSCFPFENRMMFVKKLIKATNNPLQQLHNRLTEYENTCSNILFDDIIHDKEKYISSKNESVQFDNFIIDSKEKNRYVLLKSNQIFKFISSYKENNTLFLKGEIFLHIKDLYDLPIKSSSINIYALTLIETKNVIVIKDDVKRKMFTMNIDHIKDDGTKLIKIFFPL